VASARSTDNPIPYVADFCFGTDGTPERTGWQQDPRPRPFYASAVLMGASRLDNDYAMYHSDYTLSEYKARLRSISLVETFQPFVKAESQGERPIWEFYRIPDSVNISASRIYVEG